MRTQADHTNENKNSPAAKSMSKPQSGQSTFQLEDNRPEVTNIRNLREAIHNSPQVKQLRAYQQMANNRPQTGLTMQFKHVSAEPTAAFQQATQFNNALQMQSAEAPLQFVRVPVGFDRVSAATNPGADSLVTSGLGNCIAVAVQDLNTGVAVMGHLDTATIIDNLGAFQAFRTLMLNELQRAAGGAPNPAFHISLGAVWMQGGRSEEDDNYDGWWNMRFTLLMNCREAFGIEPTMAGGVAEFDLNTGQMTGSGRLGQEANLVAPPNNDPHGRAGDSIPYDRLRRGNVRGHKLDKNMGLLDKASVKFDAEKDHF